MKRDFNTWLKSFKSSISNYGYYTDFNKVLSNVSKLKVELNILNSLIGSKNIVADFLSIVKRYPETLRCIPILLAVRQLEIETTDTDGMFLYNFDKPNYSVDQYVIFMQRTGLFDLLEHHLINNLVDYVLGVEVGLDSNGRKNRGGTLMANLVELNLKKLYINYYREMTISKITANWNIDLSRLSNQGRSEKRFDFVVYSNNTVYAIETNFYASGGSKLSETARSYKLIALESINIPNFEFVWFTDGNGWVSARNNLEETFDVMQHIYNIDEINNGIMHKIFM
jgi:type II restriction enzyme